MQVILVNISKFFLKLGGVKFLFFHGAFFTPPRKFWCKLLIKQKGVFPENL